MALILFIDTSAAEGLLGLAADGGWIQTKTLADARQLGETLHPEVSGLLRAGGKSVQALNAVAVVSGPGSYTGLRVGMAAAKGWCLGLGIPLLAINRLELLFFQFRRKGFFSGNTLLLLPARTGEWFALGGNDTGNLVLPARHLDNTALNGLLAQSMFEQVVVAGSESEAPATPLEVKLTFVENKAVFEGLDTFLEEQYLKKMFSDLTTAKPEYLKGVYIAS